MKQYPIEQYKEALVNSSGRFRTLHRIFAVEHDGGDLAMRMTSNAVNFDVDIAGEPYTLKCLTNNNLSQRMAAIEVPVGAPFVPWRYLQAEMMIFDSMSRPAQVDVVLEKQPCGLPLNQFVVRASKEQLIDALRSLCSLAQRLSECGFVHNNLKPSNIVVGSDMTMSVVNYEWSEICAEKTDRDNVALASMALALYVYATAPTRNNLFIRHNLMSCLRRMDDIPLSAILLRNKEILPNRGYIEQEMVRLWQMCAQSSDTTRLENYYDEVGRLSDNVRAVMRQGCWSYLDAKGEPLFETTFDYAEDFISSRAVVACDERFGLIDISGEYILPMNFEDVRHYPLARVVVATLDGKSRLYDIDAVPICDTQYDWIGDCEQGCIAVAIDDKYGFVDYRGNVVIELIYDNAYDFRGGVAIVELSGHEMIIDLSGRQSEHMISKDC